MTTVFLVSSGDYDDYQVLGIFATLTGAQAAHPPPDGYRWGASVHGYWYHAGINDPALGHHKGVIVSPEELGP